MSADPPKGFQIDVSRFASRLKEAFALFSGGENSKLLRRFADFTETQLLQDSAQSFRSESDPTTGFPWKKSLRAAVQSGKTLADTGRLKKSVRTRSTVRKSVVSVYGGVTSLVYGPIHQFGGTIVPRRAKFLRFQLATGQWRKASKVTLPARPFVGMSRPTVAKIQKFIQQTGGGLMK